MSANIKRSADGRRKEPLAIIGLGVRLSLEKPLSVKYIDVGVFNRLKDKNQAQESEREKSLKDFLKEF